MNRNSIRFLSLMGLAGCVGLATWLPSVFGQTLTIQPAIGTPKPIQTTERRIIVHTVDAPSDAIHQLVDKWRQTAENDTTARETIERELKTVLTAKFDEHQQERERQIEELQKRLDRLRQIQSRRASNKDDIIERHQQHLLLDAAGMGWGNEGREPGIVTEDFRAQSDDVLFRQNPNAPSDLNLRRN